jgi:hypothetical protein
MVASNANSHRPAINFSQLLTKLKVELPETPKKPRIAKKFYPTEAQRRLLDVCGYKNFFNTPGFDSVREVNLFVAEHADYRNEFEKKYGAMPCPGMCSVSRNSLHHAFCIFF